MPRLSSYFAAISLLVLLYLNLADAPIRAQTTEKPGPLVAPFDAAQAKTGQMAWAKSLKVDHKVTNSTGLEMILIPPGEYLRGASEADVAFALKGSSALKVEDFKGEQPQHRTRITKPFRMSKFETTQEQFQKIMGRNPSRYSATGKGKNDVKGLNTSHFPVDNATWYDCVEFSNKLSALEGKKPYYRISDIQRGESQCITRATVSILNGTGYRLPTEAEWEYACRAGTTTVFDFGNKSNGEQSNVNGYFQFGTRNVGPRLGRTCQVGSYPANQFGLCDMCGNLKEWCQDPYHQSAYSQFANKIAIDPIAVKKSDSRVLRGGYFDSDCKDARCTYRDGASPGLQLHGRFGFRVACGVETP